MPNELIEFWKQCKMDKPLFFHPADHDVLWQKGDRLIETNNFDFDAFVKNPSFGDNQDNRLHLSLRPIPYLGNLAEAKIFILLLNPGLVYADYWAESKCKALCRRLEGNLQQSFDGNDFPFFAIDPQFCWWSGFVWWERKLHDVISRIAREQYDNKYVEAMRDLSTKLACLELIPYHSSKFGAHALVRRLESVKMVKKFVKKTLIPKAEKGDCTLIVTRQSEEWGFQADEKHKKENFVVYRGGETRGASLGSKSKGGKAILKSYGIIE